LVKKHPFNGKYDVISLFINKKINTTELVKIQRCLVQMAGIEPARFIQPQDFKNSGLSNIYCYLTLLNSFYSKQF
jgi:hypothetical protein